MATQNSHIFRLCLQLVVFICCTSGALGSTDVSLECPSTYKEGENVTIKCRVNTTAAVIPPCSTQPTAVLFQFSTESGSSTTLCSAAYAGTCSGNPSCGCSASSGDVKTYQVVFAPNATKHNRGSLSCTVNCAALPPLSTSVSPGCQTLQVDYSMASNIHGLTTCLVFNIVLSGIIALI